MRNVSFLILILAISAGTLAAQSAEQVAADITYLASDDLEGRGVGTSGLAKAADYLAERFAEIGLEPAGTNGFFQEFALNPSAPALAHAGIAATDVRNIVGKLPGSGPLAGDIIILGAHYDHLGYGNTGGSLDADSGVHNGADDNASGTAALMQAAEILASRSGDRRTFYFVAFAAEELGLLGSDYFAKTPATPLLPAA